MADEGVLRVLRGGVERWNIWCRERTLPDSELFGSSAIPHEHYWADLSEADLRGAELPGVHFVGINLRGANLRGANLAKARLERSNLSDANLRMAELPEAKVIECYLNRADLTGADFTGADLQGADLQGATLKHTKMKGANLTAALFGDTIIADVDLSGIRGLPAIRHNSPSSVGIDTIWRSQAELTFAPGFLQRFGIPDELVKRLISGQALRQTYHSMFISHSGRDQDFVRDLHRDLEYADVSQLFLALTDVKTGEIYAESIAESIRSHDKLIVVLSAKSLESPWVSKEVRLAIEKETAVSKVVVPIRIDDAVLTTSEEWAKSLRDNRHIADFTGWRTPEKYQKSLARLLDHLKKVMAI